MGGATFAGPAGAATGVRPGTAVFRVRAAPPVPRGRVVDRPRVLRRLADAGEQAVLLRAPAGYGKTTALAQWVAVDQREVRWITVRGGCSAEDLGVAVVSALTRLAPLDPRLGRAGAGLGGVSGWQDLLLESVERAQPCLLVLDGADRLAGPEAARLLADLAAAIPSGATLALSARRELSEPLAALRHAGLAAEVGAEDLAMSPGETAAALVAMGARATTDAAAEVHDRTGGWALAVRMAALGLRAGGPGSGIPVSGAEGPFAAYLAGEVLAAVSCPVYDMLVQTSVLERVSPELAAFMTGDPDAGEHLAALRAEGIPVADGDPARGVAVHPLLREHLGAALRRTSPEMEAPLHLLAGRWYAAEGRPDEAFAHALAAGDRVAARRLFARHALTGGALPAGTTTRWRTALTAADALADPGVAVAIAWHDARRGSSDAARYLAIGSRSERRSAPPAGFGSMRAAGAAWRAAFGTAGLAAMAAAAQEALAAEPLGSPAYALTSALAGAALLLAGRDEEAVVRLRDAQMLVPPERPADEQLTLALVSLADLRAGRRDAARGALHMAAEVIAAAGLRDDPWTSLTHAVTAALLADEGDRPGVSAQLRAADRLADRVAAAPWMAALVHLLAARALRTIGEPDGSEAQVAAARAIVARWPGSALLEAELAAQASAAPPRVCLPAPVPPEAPRLSEAETRVLELLASPRSLREIASERFLSRNTVKTHVSRIYRKLGVSSRTEAVERGRLLGLIGG